MADATDVSYQINRQKIILTGDIAVGKTSIINALLNSKFNDEYEPSIGVDFFSKTMNYKGKQIKLQIWDSAGQEKFRSLIPNYIRGASIIFLVYDITKKETFAHLPDWIKFINNIENTNIIIVGNKIDLEESREINFEEGKKFAEANNCEIFEVSAKDGTGLIEMLINSIATLPIFSMLNNDKKMTKEEIVQCLRKENYEENSGGNEGENGNEDNDEIGYDAETKQDGKQEFNQKSDIDRIKTIKTMYEKRRKCC